MSGAEIVVGITQPVISAVVGRVTSSWLNVLAAHRKAGRRGESPGASPEQRKEAYSRLRWSVIEFRTSLSVLVAAPPRLVGALWSVPLYLRMLHRIPDLSSELLDRLLAVHTVGRLPAIEAADTMLTRLASAVDVYLETSGDWHAGQDGKVKVGVELAKVDEALADFTVAVRGDLGFGDGQAQGDSAPVRDLDQG